MIHNNRSSNTYLGVLVGFLTVDFSFALFGLFLALYSYNF